MDDLVSFFHPLVEKFFYFFIPVELAVKIVIFFNHFRTDISPGYRNGKFTEQVLLIIMYVIIVLSSFSHFIEGQKHVKIIHPGKDKSINISVKYEFKKKSFFLNSY